MSARSFVRRLDLGDLLTAAAAAVACLAVLAGVMVVRDVGWWLIPIALAVAVCVVAPRAATVAGLTVLLVPLAVLLGLALGALFIVGLITVPWLAIPAFLLLTFLVEPEKWGVR